MSNSQTQKVTSPEETSEFHITHCGGEGVCAIHEVSVKRFEERMREQTLRTQDQDRQLAELRSLVSEFGKVVSEAARSTTILSTTAKVAGAVLLFVASGAFIYTTLVADYSKEGDAIISKNQEHLEQTTLSLAQSVATLTSNVDNHQRMLVRNQALDDARDIKDERALTQISELSHAIEKLVIVQQERAGHIPPPLQIMSTEQDE